ncbi:MAG: hypothetical protein JWQ89_2750, partial [Devosia sp.]|nr:hypothetical protein [Devosia sp.]
MSRHPMMFVLGLWGLAAASLASGFVHP